MTGTLRKKAEDLLRGEVAEYDAYLRGECYGFELYKTASFRIAAGASSEVWKMPVKQWRIICRTSAKA